MFRDDHEAALARLQALEEELAREREKDVKQESRLAELAEELAAAKDKLRETEAELAKHKPPPRPRDVAPTPQRQPQVRVGPLARPRDAALAIFVAMGFIAFIAHMVTRSQSRPKSESPSPAARAPAVPRFLPDQVSDVLPEVRARGQELLPGGRMVELDGKGITSDGTLHEMYGALEATFYVKVVPPEPEVDPSVPVGAAPPVARSSLDEHRCVYVRRTAQGFEAHPLASMDMCIGGGIVGSASEVDPRCSMRSIWSRAIEDGAPRDAIARITYRRNSWRFAIDDQRLQFNRSYDDDCSR